MTHNTTVHLFRGVAIAAILALTACGEDETASAPPVEAEADVITETEPAASAAPAAAAIDGASEEAADDGAFYGDYVVGDEDAPITLVEYASFTCGHCASFHKVAYPQLMENYIEPGKVKFVFRHYVRDAADVAASVVARCQGRERFGAMKDLFFDRQAQWMSGIKTIQDAMDNLASLARRAGVSRAEFDQCMANKDLQNHVIEMTQNGAREYNITGTPALVMNGELLPVQANLYEELDRILTEQLS